MGESLSLKLVTSLINYDWVDAVLVCPGLGIRENDKNIPLLRIFGKNEYVVFRLPDF